MIRLNFSFRLTPSYSTLPPQTFGPYTVLHCTEKNRSREIIARFEINSLKRVLVPEENTRDLYYNNEIWYMVNPFSTIGNVLAFSFRVTPSYSTARRIKVGVKKVYQLLEVM